MMNIKPSIWFPTVKTNTGTDVFTKRLVEGLNKQGIRAEITWLPHYAEYLPWIVPIPKKPDWANIVHINSWLYPRFIPKNIPIVTTVHLCVQDTALKPYKSLAQELYHQFWVTPIEQYNLKQAQAVTSVSQYTQQKIQDIFHLQQVQLIYNGIDIDKFQYQEKMNSTSTFKLLFAGSNSIRKGFDILPAIMEQLGDEYELLFTTHQSHHATTLPKNMRVIPYCTTQEEMVKLYHQVDALIFPSRLEGFGLVVAEAMACGCPVIAANASTLPELIQHHTTGFLCEKDNIDDFVQMIRFLKNNPQRGIEIAQAARQFVIEWFNIDSMLQQYIDTYTEILSKHS